MTGYVLIIFTGGTISFVREKQHSEAYRNLGSGELLPGNLRLPDGIATRVSDPFQVMSESLTWSHIGSLVSAVRNAMKDSGLVGIVISHGTDTMEEVAYLLDLLEPWGKPIVFTGAMRHPALPSADGEANLRDAITVACQSSSVGRGVLVVMNQEIHAARYVSKEHSTSLGSFGSPGRGPMGRVLEGKVRYDWTLHPHTKTFTFPVTQPKVELIRLGLSPSTLLFDACLQSGVDGVVVEGYGAGHVSEHLLPVLKSLAEKVPVCVVPRTAAGGPLVSTYTYPGSELSLRASGIRIEEGPGIKARLRLMLEVGDANVRA